MKTTSSPKDLLDKEWIDLILTARKMGLSIEEIRFFLVNSPLPFNEEKTDYFEA
ncbi:DNA-binding anti-repressor SinI [Brevibacillus sp. RS1.1]|uniref:anti-repressor SinI family protein n=1 Tax=Brevibacillus sp. RS1.1 TaxID=2738982 RepID=UPI00156BD627|nr:anti-repressor SinI family protein [Brevibacillus sp. RS1.1]NRR05770.1 DNA-binding anti-repressor SinI [Brevibacillus sp. RS1.1]